MRVSQRRLQKNSCLQGGSIRRFVSCGCINYSKTRDICTAYRKAGYSRNFFEAHREEITLHKAAKEAFDALPGKMIPKIRELNKERQQLIQQKKQMYSEYRAQRDQKNELIRAKRNADLILSKGKEQSVDVR